MKTSEITNEDWKSAVGNVTRMIRRDDCLAWGEHVRVEISDEHVLESYESSDPIIVGLDTNVALEMVRRKGIGEEFSAWVDHHDEVFVIIPMQTYQESWNNIGRIINQWPGLLKKIDGWIDDLRNFGAAPNYVKEELEGVRSRLKEDEGFLYANKSEAIEELNGFFDKLLGMDNAYLSAYPRHDDGFFYDVRIGSKTAPGFEDAKNKAHFFGDFSLWLDFLLGVKIASDKMHRDAPVIMLTGDRKCDWAIDSVLAHPLMHAEVRALTNRSFHLATCELFKKDILSK